MVEGERWRRLRAAELPDRDAELAGLVSEVVLNARTREVHDADWQDVEHLVVALKRCCLGVLRPVGLEGDLRHVAMIGPTCGDALGALWAAAVQQHHVRVLGMNLVERSAEHTSELQSLMRTSYAVFCLKKKKTHTEQSRN